MSWSSPCCSSRCSSPTAARERWVWAACWAAVIASLGYTLSFGTHDVTVLRDSLLTDLGIPVLLLEAPAFLARPPAAASP